MNSLQCLDNRGAKQLQNEVLCRKAFQTTPRQEVPIILEKYIYSKIILTIYVKNKVIHGSQYTQIVL